MRNYTSRQYAKSVVLSRYALTQAATNFLLVTIPTNLQASASGTGTLYRVTVTTSQGTGNGVGCNVMDTWADTFKIRPTTAYIVQPPGTGKATLVVGGGVPPYHLVQQNADDLAIAVANLNGPVLDVVALTNIGWSGITVRVEDSSVPPQNASADINVRQVPFAPGFSATFHTLSAGIAPGLTLTASAFTLDPQIEKTELQFRDMGIEVSRLWPGQIVGVLRLFSGSTSYGFQHLAITEVASGRARFNAISLADGGMTILGQGELIESPPSIVIDVPNLKPRLLSPTSFDQELVFANDIFRLPATAGRSFSVTANFTSVSIREDKYLPLKASVTRSFTTTGLAASAPRIDSLVPVQGEVGRNIRMKGAGFGATPADNVITFTGPGGTRVPAEIVLQTNGDLFITVPPGALTGSVQLTVGGRTSNEYLFYVRFHPETALVFEGITNSTPTSLRLLQQQPPDDGETAGEIPLQSIVCTLAAGHIVVTNLTLDQQVGTATRRDLSYGDETTYPIFYRGPEAQPPSRHVFEAGFSSSASSARLYYSEVTSGSGVILEVGPGIFPFEAGVMWDYLFTQPIYRPPAGSGKEVAVQLEMISQQWMSVSGNEMRVIRNSLQPLQ